MKDMEEVRKDFPLLKNFTYLDSASTSLTPKPVIESMSDYYYNYNANTGRGAYKIAIKAGEKLEETRQKIGKLINVSKNEVVFTKNTTEAINIIANGLKFENKDNIIISNIEHHSNLIPWLNLQPKIDIRIVNATKDYIVNPQDIKDSIDENTKLIAINHVSNAFGSVEDIVSISKIAHEHDAFLLVDGAQSIGHIPIDIKKLKPDFMAFPGHKGLLGPLGTGFLYLKKELANNIHPKNLGGGTVINVKEKKFTLDEVPYRFEGGTQNISGIIGLNTAIDYITNIGILKIKEYCENLTKELYQSLNAIKNIEIYGNPKNIHNIVSFNVVGLNHYDVAKILDENSDICVRSGFHCAIPGIKSLASENGTIRASIHCYNNLGDISKLADSLEDISKFLV
jgi:cysteine desulfurase/selenocysteine lyase